jgi:nucleoside-diphosphate-sugar epimerase
MSRPGRRLRPVDQVLVSGATGWLGARLVRALLRGLKDDPALAGPQAARVRALAPTGDAEAGALEQLGADLARGDPREPASLAAFLDGAAGATLFVPGALRHPRLFVRDLFEHNVEGGRALLEAAARAGVRRAVVVSSSASFGVARRDGELFDEEERPCRPALAHGESARAIEAEAAEVARRTGLELVLVRAPWLYGPGQPAAATTFLRMARAGTFPVPGDGSNLRSMAFVDTVCQGLVRAARAREAAGRTYWLADTRPYALSEIVATAQDVLERDFLLPVERRRRWVPRTVPRVARLADRALQALGLYQHELHALGELDRTVACSIDRARAELGFQPRVELREGLRRSVEDCLTRGIAL